MAILLLPGERRAQLSVRMIDDGLNFDEEVT